MLFELLVNVEQETTSYQLHLVAESQLKPRIKFPSHLHHYNLNETEVIGYANRLTVCGPIYLFVGRSTPEVS